MPLIAFGVVSWLENKYQPLPVLNKLSDTDNPEYAFTNHHNEKKMLAEWKNKILVADFFFTRCPTICPKMTNNMKTVAIKFKDNSDVQLLSFTVDPGNDSADKLMKYAESKEALPYNWEFLTGEKKTIYKLARKQFFLTATDGDGGPMDFIHSDKIVLVDKQNNIRGYYDGTSEKEVQQLINDVKKL